MSRWTGGRGRVRAVVAATLVTASVGWAVLGIGGWAALGGGSGAGAATSLARHVNSHCSKSTTIPHTYGCKSKTLSPGRSGSASSDTIKVEPTGRGTVAVGIYYSDPAPPLASSTGKFFGVSVTAGDAFTSLTVKDCALGGGTTLYWLDGSTWLPVTLQPGSIASATLTCVTDTLGSGSSPTIAEIVKLSRTSRFGAVIFGVK